ncbi:MAG TPA: TIGR02391 family protein [Arachnia sp.]|nr:TIGR02391 family protein [Arachnia sp.]HMT86163.1 TIGR02391 family protein [Arachnia sp.]
MSDLNKQWAKKQLEHYLWATTKVPNGELTAAGNPRMRLRVTGDELEKLGYVVGQIIIRVFPGIELNWHWTAHVRERALQALTELEREEELRQNLGDSTPPLSATELHPWVWESARPFWGIAQYSAAIWTSLLRLNSELQRTIGRRDVSEADAFVQAFTPDRPQPGKPRLRLMPDDGSKTYQNRQRGTMLLAQGLFTGVRNPLGHEPAEEPSEQEALETLAAISLLARWVTRAELVEAPENE